MSTPSQRRRRIALAVLLPLAAIGLIIGTTMTLPACAKGELVIPFSDEELAQRAQDEARVASGREFYVASCRACHGKGGVGFSQYPSLVDDEWLKGSGPREIYRSIATGAPAKGMPAWGSLKPEKLADLTAYVLYLNK